LDDGTVFVEFPHGVKVRTAQGMKPEAKAPKEYWQEDIALSVEDLSMSPKFEKVRLPDLRHLPQ
jgi:hypothetical protein